MHFEKTKIPSDLGIASVLELGLKLAFRVQAFSCLKVVYLRFWDASRLFFRGSTCRKVWYGSHK